MILERRTVQKIKTAERTAVRCGDPLRNHTGAPRSYEVSNCRNRKVVCGGLQHGFRGFTSFYRRFASALGDRLNAVFDLKNAARGVLDVVNVVK